MKGLTSEVEELQAQKDHAGAQTDKASSSNRGYTSLVPGPCGVGKTPCGLGTRLGLYVPNLMIAKHCVMYPFVCVLAELSDAV